VDILYDDENQYFLRRNLIYDIHHPVSLNRFYFARDVAPPRLEIGETH
jgi:hypothetical protein